MTRLHWLPLFAGLLAPAAVPAQETFTIKLRQLGVGDTVRVEKTEAVTARTQVLDPGGTEVSAARSAEQTTETVTYRETILAQEGRQRPTRLTRHHEKAQAARQGGKSIDWPYQGQTVLVEKQEGRYRFRVEGGKEFTAAEVPLLEKEFNEGLQEKPDLEKLLLPTGPVTVNSPWKVDMEVFAREFARTGGAEVDPAEAAGTGVLRKVYTRDGRRFGELHFQLNLPLRALGQGQRKLATQPGSRFAIDVVMDLCIDGSAEQGVLKGTTKLEAFATLPTPAGPSKINVTLQTSTQETRREVER